MNFMGGAKLDIIKENLSLFENIDMSLISAGRTVFLESWLMYSAFKEMF